MTLWLRRGQRSGTEAILHRRFVKSRAGCANIHEPHFWISVSVTSASLFTLFSLPFRIDERPT